jgi:alpha-N-arabinofuranosidase
MAGNVFLKGAQPSRHEEEPLVLPDLDPGLGLKRREDAVTLRMRVDEDWATKPTRDLVTTELLGKAKIPDLPYVRPDGSPYRLDEDYLGKPRSATSPFPGPFELPGGGPQTLQVWPPASQ